MIVASLAFIISILFESEAQKPRTSWANSAVKTESTAFPCSRLDHPVLRLACSKSFFPIFKELPVKQKCTVRQ